MKEKNKVGETWNELFDENSYKISLKEIRRISWSFHIKFILKYAKPNDKLLEGGCGSAKFSFALALNDYEVTALDYSPHIINNVTKLLNLIKKDKPIKLTPVVGDLSNMEFDDNSFNIVFNEGVVEHWLDKQERINVIKEMVRVTKKAGYVIIIVPNGKHPLHNFWNKIGCPYFKAAPPMTMYDVMRLKQDMEDAGLQVLETDGINPWNSIGHYPHIIPLIALARVLNMLPLLPKSFREKWGIDLIAIGIKK